MMFFSVAINVEHEFPDIIKKALKKRIPHEGLMIQYKGPIIPYKGFFIPYKVEYEKLTNVYITQR